MSKIFGGSKNKSSSRSTQTSRSYNRAFPMINSLYAPMGAYSFNTGIASQDSVLGDNFEDYKSNTGFDFLKELGLKNMAGAYGSKGTLQSGAAAKALQAFGQNLQNTFADRYLGAQQARTNAGIGIGQLLAGTGNTASSSGSTTSSGSGGSNNGFGGFLGGVLGGIASERHLKTKIEKIGELEDGLGIYTYEYKKEPGITYVGTMVDEVENLRPWALGPLTEDGDRTVVYGKLAEEK